MANFSMKLTSTVSAAAIVASSVSLVSATSEFLPYADALAAKNVINAQTVESAYRLNDQITRAELAKVAANLGGYTSVSCTGTVYSDVKSTLGDLCDAIETLAAAKVISTSSSTFRPNANVTRAEMTKMILGALGIAPSTTNAGYSDVTATLGDLEGFINAAAEKGIVNKATYFRPNATGSRGEVFKIAAKAAGLEVNTDTNTPSTPSTNGTVSVALTGSATAQYVPMNASSVKVGTVKVTATGGDATVSTIGLTRSGLGEVRGLQASLAQNGVVVGNARSFNNTTQEVTVRLNNTLTLKKGTSAEFDVLVSLPESGTSNSQHQFSVTSVNGTAVSPVLLSLLNTTSYKVGEVSAASLTTYDQKSGLNGVRIASLSIQGASGRNTTVHGFSISKKSGNSLTEAITNGKVYRNGVEITNAKVTVTSDKIIVTGLETKLPAGEEAKYELRFDTTYVGDAGTYVLYMANTEDVSATEDDTGYATRTKLTTTDQTLRITGIKITTSLASNSVKTVAPGTSNVYLLDGKINSSASFEVRGYSLTAQVNGAAATANQLKAIFSSLSFDVAGSSYDLLADGVKLDSGKITYGNADSFFVDAGQDVIVRVRGTVKSGVDTTTNKNVRFTFATETLKNIDSGNTFEHTTTNLAGNTVNLKSSTLDVRGATVAAPSSKNIASSLNGVEIGRFGLEAKNADVRVAKVTVKNVATADKLPKLTDLADNSSSYHLVDLSTGAEVEATKDLSAETVTFEFAPAITVTKDTIKNYKLTVDTKSLDTDTLGKKFKAEFEVAAADATTDNGTVSLSTAKYTSGEYTAAIALPTLKVSKVTLDANSPVATVTVTNNDSDNNIAIKTLKIRVQARSTANGDVSFNDTQICLRNLGSQVACGSANTLAPDAGGKVNGAVFTFTLSDAIDAGKLISTNSSTDFDVYFNNAPLWVSGDNVAVTVEEGDYKYGEETTVAALSHEAHDSYIGNADASVTSVK